MYFLMICVVCKPNCLFYWCDGIDNTRLKLIRSLRNPLSTGVIWSSERDCVVCDDRNVMAHGYIA